ncbi:MAG: glycosyltransferase [Acidobacteriota bacterium]|nr:glycosyltransferase [Acidobacteriota bacterium]
MSERLAVCMFDNETVRGGAEEHLLGLLQGLDRARFRPLLAAPAALLDLLGCDLPQDVTLLPIELRSHRQLGRMARLASFLRREQVGVLHSHGFRPSLVASPVARFARIPVTVETPHIREYWRKGWKASFAIDRAASRFVDAYIAVSEANGRYLRDEKKLPAEKIRVIRNGCSLAHFAAAVVVPEGFKQTAGFRAHDPVLLTAARLEPQKGHAVLLRAMAALKPEFPALRLVLLGEGSLREELASLARELGLADSVLMPGHSPDTRVWMSAADVCVLPSFAEGLPLFAIESLAAARPMVATAVDGTPEIVLDKRTGLLVPPGDAAALAEAIAEVLRHPQAAAERAMEGACYVRAEFTIERQLRETEDLYDLLWTRKTGRVMPTRAEAARIPSEAHACAAGVD